MLLPFIYNSFRISKRPKKAEKIFKKKTTISTFKNIKQILHYIFWHNQTSNPKLTVFCEGRLVSFGKLLLSKGGRTFGWLEMESG